MQWWEVNRFIAGIRRRERVTRTTTRHLEWFIAKIMGDKKYDSDQELYEFPWEEEHVDKEKEASEIKQLLDDIIEENKKNGFG